MTNLRWLLALLLALGLGLPSVASAYSVRVHVYLANAVHDELVRTKASNGRYLLRLMAPEGARSAYVEIDAFDARAIVENLEYFRGGAIGPDNTVMTGLTDPSHGWMFSPFQQCTALYEEAVAREAARIDAGEDAETMDLSERAYALGCFLHGISDNNAHHVVNFFTGQTFTLHPVDQARDGELRWSLVNVVRHIVTESQFENGLEATDASATDRTRQGLAARPIGATDAEREAAFRHRIPVELVRRVYFDPSNETPTGMWQWFGGQLAERKKMALRSRLGIDSSGSIIETMVASADPWQTDADVVDAYVQFLREGGLAPADFLVLLPEILADVERLYEIVDAQGAARARAMDDEYIFRPSRRLERRMLRNAFAPRATDGDPDWEGTGQSRFADVRALKARELHRVMEAYVQVVQNVSNLNIIYGLPHTTRAQREEAIAPLRDVLREITRVHYEILFSETTVNVLETLGFLKRALDEIFALATQRIEELVLAQLHAYLDQLSAEFRRLQEEAVAQLDAQLLESMQQLREDILALRAAARDAARREALDRLALDLERGRDAFGSFLDSVLWMNTWNSVAGAMAMPGIVDPGMYASGFFAGPVSFDASYQVEYNQLALCGALRPSFYPCGTTTGEMLQPDYRTCAQIPAARGVLDPPVECHDHDPTAFADPSTGACRRSTLEEHTAPSSERIHRYDELGSYTLAFPPTDETLGDGVPTCRLGASFPLHLGEAESKEDGFDAATTGEAMTCAAAPGSTPSRGGLAALLLPLTLALLARRRRR